MTIQGQHIESIKRGIKPNGSIPTEVKLSPQTHTATNVSGIFARDVGQASRSLTKIIWRIACPDADISMDELTKMNGLDVIAQTYIRARNPNTSITGQGAGSQSHGAASGTDRHDGQNKGGAR